LDISYKYNSAVQDAVDGMKQEVYSKDRVKDWVMHIGKSDL